MNDSPSNRIHLSFNGIEVFHTYSFYPDQNIFFCNIPKCATTTIHNYIKRKLEDNSLLVLNEPFYFTIIREPIERLKSALWMITWQSYSIKSFHCPNCGHDWKDHGDLHEFEQNNLEFNIDDYVKLMKNISRTNINEQILMHAFPQSLFIENSPYYNSRDLKIYRMDQIDQIFNTKLLKDNPAEELTNPSYKKFEKNFEDQCSEYAIFLNSCFADDFKLWDLANT